MSSYLSLGSISSRFGSPVVVVFFFRGWGAKELGLTKRPEIEPNLSSVVQILTERMIFQQDCLIF